MNIRMRLILLTCYVVLSSDMALADIVTLQGSTFSDYNDGGQLLYQTTVGTPYGTNPFLRDLQVNTGYTDSTVFSNAASYYLPGTSVVSVNFFTSSGLMTIANTGILGGCSQYCGTAPPVPYPFTISPDGSSLSGEVGDCGGIPHCTDNGYAVNYWLNIHFNNPVYGIFGATSGGLMTTDSPYNGNLTLLYAGSSSEFFGYPPIGGWLFPNGISDIYVTTLSQYIDGTNPFTLSNLEVVTGTPTPEPTTALYCFTAVLFAGLYACKRLWKHQQSLTASVPETP